MPQTKIQGKFYPLKSSEWLDSISQLTHSELKILYYVRSLDPYNNGIDLSASQIAKDLSTEKNKMHRSTVGRALKSLDQKGFINMELIKVRIKVNPRGFLTEQEAESEPKSEAKNDVVPTQPCCDHATDVVTTQQNVQPRNRECAQTTESASTQQSEAETQSEQKVENSKTLKTYLDFKRSLSENERENFFKFVRKKTENLERPINDLEAWLASQNRVKQNRWEIYYKSYEEEKINKSVKLTKQGNNLGNYTPQELQDVVKKFQNRDKTSISEPKREQKGDRQPEDDSSKGNNSEEFKQKQADILEMLENPPEFGAKSRRYSTKESEAERRAKLIAELEAEEEKLLREIEASDNPDEFWAKDEELLRQYYARQASVDPIPEDLKLYRQQYLNNSPEINPEEQEDE